MDGFFTTVVCRLAWINIYIYIYFPRRTGALPFPLRRNAGAVKLKQLLGGASFDDLQKSHDGKMMRDFLLGWLVSKELHEGSHELVISQTISRFFFGCDDQKSKHFCKKINCMTKYSR